MSVRVFLAATASRPTAPAGSRPPNSDLRFTLERAGLSIDFASSHAAADTRWIVRDGIEGLDDVTSDLIEQRGSGLFGAFDRGVDVGPQDVLLPLSCNAGSLNAWFAERDRLRAVANPLLGPCRLTVTRPNGYSRFVEGRARVVTSAWDGQTWSASRGRQMLGLLLRRTNPFWRAYAPPIRWQVEDAGGDWFPWPPVVTVPSTVLGQANPVDFGGDAPTFQPWKLSGPFTQVVAEHMETGRSWTLVASADAGEVIRIYQDERGARRVVWDADGSSAFTALQPPFDLWDLPPGLSSVKVTITGATDQTSVQLGNEDGVQQQWLAA